MRHALWEKGFRYRKNVRSLPGAPDIVLPMYRTAVFIHGCFWHGHIGCRKYVTPKTNTEYWKNKVTRNQARDQEVWRQLEARGWYVVIVWECELEKKCFDATLNRVVNEIVANGETNKRLKEQRLLIRQQHLTERREQIDRHNRLMSEIKQQ